MMSRKSRTAKNDLEPYTGCPDDEWLGLIPLAIGWLRRGREYTQGKLGKMPALFHEKLFLFCQPEYTVCPTPAARPCPFCNKKIEHYGGAEIRVLGQQDIFAAPDLIHHYVTVHQYQPPAVFVDSVMNGPPPDSMEYRALRKVYLA